eukprot:scaffold27695_cov31-Tisochrysis_lutea.AAC.4
MGPVEQARLALVLGGVPFDDARFDRDSFLAKKAAGELPYGQLPTMEVDGKTVAQSVRSHHSCRICVLIVHVHMHSDQTVTSDLSMP